MVTSAESRWVDPRRERVVAWATAAVLVSGIGFAISRPWTRTAVTEQIQEPSACPQGASSEGAIGSEPTKRFTAAAKLDCSGRVRAGIASFYASRFGGRKMADGTPMRLRGDNAASRTLPLGTTAKVTNLQTDKSALITIRDRGPYVNGRIVDLSPATAQKIGIGRKQGIAEVEVAPIAVPLPDGKIKRGIAGRPYSISNLRVNNRDPI
jgi:rare lipoprotein A